VRPKSGTWARIWLNSVIGSRSAALFTLLALLPGCGARSSLLGESSPEVISTQSPVDAAPPNHDGTATTADAGHRDATADARVIVDSARRDATRDAGPTDAHRDASDAASDADACDYSGEPAGTVETLVAAPDGGIVDFDLDCQGVVYATHGGAILSCPVGGCATTPTVIAPAGTYVPSPPLYQYPSIQLRIAATGLVVVGQGATPVDGGSPPVLLFTQSRNGGPPTVLTTIGPVTYHGGLYQPWVEQLGVTTGSLVNYQSWIVVPSGLGPVAVQQAFDVFNLSVPDGGVVLRSYPFDSLNRVAIVGSAYYVGGGGSISGPNTVSLFDLNGPSSNPTTVYSGSALGGMKGLLASDAFVVMKSGGPPWYSCVTGSPCTEPTLVTAIGTGEYEPFAAFHDVLFLAGGDDGLATCDSATVLDGTCIPSEFVSGLPGFTRFVATDDNVYVLTRGAILRVAR